MKFVSPVCAEGITLFSAAWQRLKIGRKKIINKLIINYIMYKIY